MRGRWLETVRTMRAADGSLELGGQLRRHLACCIGDRVVVLAVVQSGVAADEIDVELNGGGASVPLVLHCPTANILSSEGGLQPRVMQTLSSRGDSCKDSSFAPSFSF